MKKQFANLIKALLIGNSMSKTELAKRCGVQRSMVSRWISGEHNFTIETLQHIQKTMGWELLPVAVFDIKEEVRRALVAMKAKPLYEGSSVYMLEDACVIDTDKIETLTDFGFALYLAGKQAKENQIKRALNITS